MPHQRPRLLTIGDLTLDIVVSTVAGADVGTDVPARVAFRPGGSAANTARAFARLGGASTFVGAVGTDRVGRLAAQALVAEGVTTRVVAKRGHTARLIVSLAKSGERSFLTDRGVADRLAWRDVKTAWLRGVDVLHLPAYSLLNPPLCVCAFEAARRAHAAGSLVSIDLASRRPLMALGRKKARTVILAHHPDVLFANRDEATALTGSRGVARLLDLAPIVVVKAGAAGCRLLWGDVDMAITARPFKATDSTGAGDAFDAGFLFSLISTGRALGELRRLDLRHAAYDGQKAAAAFIRGPRRELEL